MSENTRRAQVSKEIMLPVMCQDEWYGRGELPQDIRLDDAELVFDERGDPSIEITVSANLPESDEE